MPSPHEKELLDDQKNSLAPMGWHRSVTKDRQPPCDLELILQIEGTLRDRKAIAGSAAIERTAEIARSPHTAVVEFSDIDRAIRTGVS